MNRQTPLDMALELCSAHELHSTQRPLLGRVHPWLPAPSQLTACSTLEAPAPQWLRQSARPRPDSPLNSCGNPTALVNAPSVPQETAVWRVFRHPPLVYFSGKLPLLRRPAAVRRGFCGIHLRVFKFLTFCVLAPFSRRFALSFRNSCFEQLSPHRGCWTETTE